MAFFDFFKPKKTSINYNPIPLPNIGYGNKYNPIPLPQQTSSKVYGGQTTIPPSNNFQTSSSQTGGYTVQSGDTLSSIAARNGISLSSLLANNPQFQFNPNLIRPGQSVNLGGATGGVQTQPIPQIGGGTMTVPTLGGTQTGTETPVIPDLSKFEKDYEIASKNYEALLKLSPEELSTQADLDKLTESTQTAYRNISGQAIPLEFITGQSKAVERRALGLAEPLQAKLARLQAQRLASLEGSKFSLEKAKGALDEEKRKRDELLKPKEVSEGQKIVRFNPQTGQYEEVFNYPKSKTATSASGITGQASEINNKALVSAQDLLNKFDTGMGSGAVGAKGLSSFFGIKDTPLAGTQAADFTSTFDNLKSLLSLENISLLKGQGAISDAERDTLQKASTKLNRDQSEEEFRRTLIDVINTLQHKGAGTQSFTTNLNTGSSNSTNDAYLKSLGF